MEINNGNSTYFRSDIWLLQGDLIDVLGESGVRQFEFRQFAKVSEVVMAVTWNLRRCRQPVLRQLVDQIMKFRLWVKK